MESLEAELRRYEYRFGQGPPPTAGPSTSPPSPGPLPERCTATEHRQTATGAIEALPDPLGHNEHPRHRRPRQVRQTEV